MVNYMWQLDLKFSNYFFIVNSFLLLIIVFITTSKKIWSTHFFDVLTLSIFMPILVISNHIGSGMQIIFLAFSSMVFTFYLYYLLSNSLYINSFFGSFGRSISNKTLDFLLLTIGIIFLTFFLINNLGSIGSFDLFYIFENLYKIREEDNTRAIDNYFSRWFVSIILPALIASYFYKGSKVKMAVAIIGVYILFVTLAMKIHFFMFFLLCFFAIGSKLNKFILENLVYLFFIGIFLMSWLIGDFLYPFLDRFFYLPGQLNHHYFEFFESNPFNYFDNSKIGLLFVESGYDKPIGFVIDDYFYGGGMNANTGYIASIYSELGFLGVFLVSIALSVVLIFLEHLNIKFKTMGYLVSIGIAFELINAPFTNIILSNGLIFVLLIAIFVKDEFIMYPNNNYNN